MKNLVFFGLLRQADQLPVKYGDYAIAREEDSVVLRYKGGLVSRFEIGTNDFDAMKSSILRVLFDDLRLSEKFAGILDFTQHICSFGEYITVYDEGVFKLVLKSERADTCFRVTFELTDTQIEVFSRDVLAFAKYLRYEVL